MGDSRRRGGEDMTSKARETEQATGYERDDFRALTDDQLDTIAGGVLIVPTDEKKTKGDR